MNCKTENYFVIVFNMVGWTQQFLIGRRLRTTGLNECGGSYQLNCIIKNGFGTAI